MFKSKSFAALFPVSFLFFICCIYQPAYAQKSKIYDLVKDFKAVPDNKTDNYLAFVKAAETLSNAGGGQLNIPKGNYYIAAYKSSVVNKLYTAGDIIFKNCNNLTVIGNNSVIRVNGNFTRNAEYQLPGLSNNYCRTNTVCPFKIMNCKNVLLKDITLYGEVDKMRKGQVVEGDSYGVFVSDDEPTDISSKIVLQNITTHHFAADGLLIKSNGEDILINKCNSYKNARQGLSIVKGKNIRVLNSSFDSTGVTGAYGWHAPGAGIDVENEFGQDKLSNVLIRNCSMRGNNGFQVVTTLSSDKVIIDSCFISDTEAGYADALHGVGMYSLNSAISNCIIFGGIQIDIADQIYTGPMVQAINKNIIYSGNRAIVSSDFGRPVNITDNILIMLPGPKEDGFFLYIQNFNSVFNRNMVVVHADRLKNRPNTVVILTQFCKEVMEDFWLVNGYDIPVEKRRTVSYMIATDKTKILKEHFFSPSSLVSQYNFNKTHFLTDVQLHAIFSKEMFGAYKQNSFNPRFLSQANDVRRYSAGVVSEAKQHK